MEKNGGSIASTLAGAKKPKTKWKGVGSFLRKAPMFFYMLVIFVIVELSVTNMREVFVSTGLFELTWVEVIILMGACMGMFEILRVSHPGVDNTVQALFMAFVWVVYLILLLLSVATRAPMLSIFGNTEFAMLMLLSLFQVILAFMVNARTLKRTIDYGSAE